MTPSSSGGTTTHSPGNDVSNINVGTITGALNSGTNVTINVNGTVMDREGTADSIRELLNDSLSRGGVLRAA